MLSHSILLYSIQHVYEIIFDGINVNTIVTHMNFFILKTETRKTDRTPNVMFTLQFPVFEWFYAFTLTLK